MTTFKLTFSEERTRLRRIKTEALEARFANLKADGSVTGTMRVTLERYGMTLQ